MHRTRLWLRAAPAVVGSVIPAVRGPGGGGCCRAESREEEELEALLVPFPPLERLSQALVDGQRSLRQRASAWPAWPAWLAAPPAAEPTETAAVEQAAALEGSRDEGPDWARVDALRASISSADGWIPSAEYDGIRCSYQKAPAGQGIVRIRAEAKVHAPLFDLLSLFYEVQFWPRWAPSLGQLGLRRASCLGQRDMLHFVYQLEANLPWPFHRRTCRFAVEPVDCMFPGQQPQQIAILLDSREASRVCPNLSEAAAPGAPVPAELLESGFLLTPSLDGDGTLVQGLLNVDPHMNVPDWLLAFAAMNLCLLTLMRFRDASHLARSPEFLAKSCDPEHPFYAHIRRRMAETLPRQLALAPPLREPGR